MCQYCVAATGSQSGYANAADDLSLFPGSARPPEEYSASGGKWGPSGTLGTNGGVLTWSFAGAGWTGPAFNGSSVDFSTVFSFDFAAVIRSAFDAWSTVADIEFIQVADEGGNRGDNLFADIRLFAAEIDGASNVLANAFLPFTGGTAFQDGLSGDTVFDKDEGSFWTADSLFLVAVHEIGHALGLNHEATNPAIMNPFYNPSLTGLLTDDINGIQSIYGVQDNGTNTYTLAAGRANLTVIDGAPNLQIVGNSLGNVITTGSGAQALVGGDGSDTLNGGAGIDTMTGGADNDTYYVDTFDDIIVELNGQGFDVVYASSSYTLGAQSIEELRASPQSSTLPINLSGNGFSQLLSGNNGDNTLNGNGGADQMYGRNGNDIFIVDNAGDVTYETTGQGTDSVFAKASYTLTTGQSIETLGTTSQSGTTAINLTGNNLNQTVNGNNGSNVINGGAGTDTLFGRQGNDTFVFNTTLGASNIDTVGDYNVAADTIQLSQAIFTGIGATLDAGEFVIGSAALDADDRIIYNSATGALIFDSNGSTAGGAQQFATLSTGLALVASEFVMIA